MRKGNDNRSHLRRSALSCVLMAVTVATLIAGTARVGGYAEAATVARQSVGCVQLAGSYAPLVSRLGMTDAVKNKRAGREGVSSGGLSLFQASEGTSNEVTLVEPTSESGYVEEFKGDGTYVEEFRGDGTQTPVPVEGDDNVVVVGDGGAGEGVEVVAPEEVVSPGEDTGTGTDEVHAWPTTLTQTATDAEGNAYTVTVTFGEEAGIPFDAALKVSVLEAIDSRVSSQHAAVSLGDEEISVGDWFIDVSLEHNGQVCVPTGTVDVVVETAAIDAGLSDALELTIAGAPIGRENLTDSGATTVTFTTGTLGEIGLTAIERRATECEILSEKVVVWGPRSTNISLNQNLNVLENTPAVGVVGVGTITVSVDPSRPNPTTLFVTTERPSDHRLRDGLIMSVDGQDTTIFGIDGTTEPVQISTDVTYALSWDTGLKDDVVSMGDVEVAGPLPVGVELSVRDVRAETADGESVTGVSDGVKYAYDVIGAYVLSFMVGRNGWAPDANHADRVTISGIPVKNDHEVQVWHREGDGYVQVEDVTFEDGSISFMATDDGTYVLIDKVSLERTFASTDDETYRMTVTYDGSAGLPRDVYLEVSSLATEGPDYLMSMIESARSLGSDAKRIAYAQLFDIALVDPLTGLRYHPSEGVSIEVELLSANVSEEDAVGVVNLGNDLLSIESVCDGSTVGFDADGASSYAVVVTTVEKAITASDGKTYEVTVTYDSGSGIPAGAALEVKEIVEGDEGYDEYVAASTQAMGESARNVAQARAFDISFVNPETGETYQPTKGVEVRILLMDEGTDAEGETSVVHFPSDGSEAEVLATSVNDGTIEFGTEGFSVFVVVYTVDFHFGDYTYSIAGESEVTLGNLLERLGVTEIGLDEVEGVSFSNPAYVGVEQTESDWVLKSLKPFGTNETLTLTLTDGTTVDIHVTDAQTDAAPTAKEGLVYSGEEQALIEAGTSSEGTMVYSLVEDGEYSAAIPEAKDAGNFTVFYKVRHNDQTEGDVSSVDVTIRRAPVTVTATDMSKKAGAAEPDYEVTVAGLVNDESASLIAYTKSRPDKDEPDGELSGDHTIVVTGEAEQGNYSVTYVNGILTIEKLTITFKDGDTTVRTCEVELNESLAAKDLEGEDKETCDFKGWYRTTGDGEEKVDTDTTFVEDAELNARYTVTVTFRVKDADYQETTSSSPVIIDKGAAIGDDLLNDPFMRGYKFDGWFIEGSDGKPTETKVTAATEFDAHASVVAKFTKQVTIIFDTEGTRHEFVVDVGDEIELLENPVRANARFDGWFDKSDDTRKTNAEGITDADGHLVDLDGNPLQENAEPVRKLKAKEDLTLYAKFVDQITVEFVVVHPETKSDSTGYPSLNSEAKFTLDKTKDGLPVEADFYKHVPSVSGYYFLGWYHIKKVNDGPAAYDPSSGSSTFVIPNSAENGKVYELDEDRPAYVRDETAAADYPTFKEDTILVAKFAKEVTITFRFKSEDDTNEVAIRDRCLVGKLLSDYYLPLEEPSDDPEVKSAYREGYRIEWLHNGKKVDPDYEITASDDNAVYDARYIQQVTVQFKDEDGNPINDTGGNKIEPVKRDADTALGALPKVVETIGTGNRQRHFMGWFDESDRQYTAETILTEDVTLKARYGYRVTFNVEGDDAWEFERLVAPGAQIGWMPGAPFREGYSFRSWTLNNQVVDGTHVVNQNETIFGYYDGVSIYTITVNYVVYENGTPEAEPTDCKILAVDKGALSEKPVLVPSPTSFKKNDKEYFPVMQELQIVPSDDSLGVNDKHESVTVSSDDGDANKFTITVPYKEADADYKVQYMLKDLTGDGYTKIEEKNLRGVLGAYVSPEIKEYDYAEWEQSDTGSINEANGQTFRVYYTRKYFTLTYDTGDGDPIGSETVRYGTEITLPTDTSDPQAKRNGYTFKGWYDNPEYNGNAITKLTLEGNTTLFAEWEADSVNYTIVYMKEVYDNDIDDTSFVYDRSDTTKSAKVGSVVKAAEAPKIAMKGYEEDTVRNEGSEATVKADGSAVLMVYYKLIRYTLVFNLNRDSGRIAIGGQTYTGSNYQINNVVVGQDVSSVWPAGSAEVYADDAFFNGWNDGYHSWSQLTKLNKIDYEYFEGANNSRTVTWTAKWSKTTEYRNAEYWLQQPDGTYKIEDSFTQIGLNTDRLSAKEIDGYTIHNGTPSGYIGSGYSTNTVQVWVEESIETSYSYEFLGEKYYDGTYIWTYEYSTSGWIGYKYYVYTRVVPGHYENKPIYIYRFYYDRARYSIDYYYGTTKLNTIDNILFESDINSSTYNYEPDKQAGVDQDYVWDGWFADPEFANEFSFTTMPGHNVAVYAKWSLPKYSATFHLNYDAADPEPYLEREVQKRQSPLSEISDEDRDKLENPTPPEHYVFTGWYPTAEGGNPVNLASTFITANTDFYAHWKPKGVSYTVRYVRADNGRELLSPKTVTGNLVVGQKVTENAPYITGFHLSDEDPEATMVADAGSKWIILDYEGNTITFKYGKKPETYTYRVRYVTLDGDCVLSEDVVTPGGDFKKLEGGEIVKEVKVPGSYTTVTETAEAPSAAYSQYRPTKVTDTLSLGREESENVLTFYYTKGAHVQVKWLDMEGDAARAPVETYLEKGETYSLDTAVSGYVLDHVERNDETTEDRTFTAANNTEEISIKAYYKKRLTIIGHNVNKTYDGEELKLEGVDDVTADGLKDGHTLVSISFDKTRTDVGSSDCTPKDAVITGLKGGLTADQFYVISYLPGTLTVTRVNVIVSVEPDRWTDNVYDGKYKAAGFTNGSKVIGEYVVINNAAYREKWLETIWSALQESLLGNGRGYVKVEDALIKTYHTVTEDGKEKRVADTRREGLQILSQKDAGDYYEESKHFSDAVNDVIENLSSEAKDNYNIIPYVRESRLQIDPAPLVIETKDAEKTYDGTPLTTLGDKDEGKKIYNGVKVSVRGTVIEPTSKEPNPDGSYSYKLAEGDTVKISATGSQTHPGKSQNIYEIDWGSVRQQNYKLSEELGTLEVKPRPIIIEAQDVSKAFGQTSDPAFKVTVYEGIAKTDDEGKPVLDADGKQVIEKGAEIDAALTHWKGDGYTLQLKDSNRHYTDNLSLKITRAEGETPGTYAITVDWAEDAVQNYNAIFKKGNLVIGIARVSDDGGKTWTYHQWLVNGGTKYASDSAYDAGTDHASKQGAFEKAKSLGGDVIIETLCENKIFGDYNIADRYILDKRVGLGQDDSLKSVVFRTTKGADFTSVISRGYSGDSLITNACGLTLENITLDGSSGTWLKGEQDGGLLHVKPGGSLNLNKGTTLRNSATNGKGGAVYVDGSDEDGKRSTLTIKSGVLITGNTAIGGGKAVFVSDGCSMTMKGGSITGNNSNDNVNAVQVGGTNARLVFSGYALVYDNTGNNGAQHNVQLDYDTASIIQADGLKVAGDSLDAEGAKIGVYVNNNAANDWSGTLFKRRGGVLDRFGTFTSKANLDAFVNDRNGLRGAARGSDEIVWRQTVQVEIRYVYNLKDFATMPTKAQNFGSLEPSEYVVMANIEEYSPSIGESTLEYDSSKLDLEETGFTIDEIEQDIYNNFGGAKGTWSKATDTMVFWRGYAENETEFDQRLEALKSDPAEYATIPNYGKWKYDELYKEVASTYVRDGVTYDNKVILYYTEPAYITIGNDSGLKLNNYNDMFVMLPEYPRTNNDTTTYETPSSFDQTVARLASTCAYVTKVGSTEQDKPYELVRQNHLSLDDGNSVTLMIPGAIGAMYWISGGFTDVEQGVTEITVERRGGTPDSDEENIVLKAVGDLKPFGSTANPKLPMSQGNAWSHFVYGKLTANTILHYGETYICKITDEDGNLLRVNGKKQAFNTLEAAFKAYSENALDSFRKADGTDATPAYIKMLVSEYDLRLSTLSGYWNWTQITVPANRPVTLSTAPTTDEELPGPYAGTAATRCVINRGNNCQTSMFSVGADATFGVENIVLDGGAKFDGEGTYVSGEVANDGGIVYVKGQGSIKVGQGTTMQNTATASTGNSGGAIYAEENSAVSIEGTSSNGATFTNCQAQGGGAIYNPGNTGFAGTTTVAYCSFENCHAKGTAEETSAGLYGGGAVRCMTNSLTLDHCGFKNCSAGQQGGAVDFGGTENLTVKDSTYEDCEASKGGAIHQAAGTCSFEDSAIERCKALNAGGGVYLSGGTFKLKSGNINSNRAGSDAEDAPEKAYGGAIYMGGSSKAEVSGATVVGNTAIGSKESRGAGIYIEKDSVLSISGASDFGGDGTKGEDGEGELTATKTVSGEEVPAGNFLTLSGYSEKLNGGEKYPVADQVRQDIYIAEKREDEPKSIVVAGDLTDAEGNYVGDGTIWVWAEHEEHYKQTMPFAVLGEGVKFAEEKNGSVPSGSFDAAHLKAFRNAQDDSPEATDNGTTTYLFGTIEGVKSGYVYWTGITGSRKVILRKVDESYDSVSGKSFIIYRGGSKTAYMPEDADDGTDGLRTGENGCFYVGMLPNGWYILEEYTIEKDEGDSETAAGPEAYFYIIVDDSGVYGTLAKGEDGKDADKVGGFDKRDDAEEEARERYAALREQARQNASETNG